MKNPFRRPRLNVDGTETYIPAVDEAPEALHYSAGKPGVDQIPVEALMAWGDVFSYGERKYARDNWLKGTDWYQFYGSALRHLYRWWGGEDVDPESELPHLAHALWNVGALFTYQARDLGRDNRHFNQGGILQHGTRDDSFQAISEPMSEAQVHEALAGLNWPEEVKRVYGVVEESPPGASGVKAPSPDPEPAADRPDVGGPVEPAWGCYCDMAPGPHPAHLRRPNFDAPEDLGDHLYIFNQTGLTEWVPE